MKFASRHLIYEAYMLLAVIANLAIGCR